LCRILFFRLNKRLLINIFVNKNAKMDKKLLILVQFMELLNNFVLTLMLLFKHIILLDEIKHVLIILRDNFN